MMNKDRWIRPIFLLLLPLISTLALANKSSPPISSIWYPKEAPVCAFRMKQTQLSYELDLTPTQRLADLKQKILKVKQLIGITNIRDLRQIARETRPKGNTTYTWEAFRKLRTKDSDPYEVLLTIKVWVPRNSKRVPVYSGTRTDWKKLQSARANLPLPSGDSWFCEKLADVNDKEHYRTETISFPTYNLHAPIVFLLFDHVFREGYYEVRKRIPIMVVRSGEDCFSADKLSGAVYAESITFSTELGSDYDCKVLREIYQNYGKLLNSEHVKFSNHKIGCALDVNNFEFGKSVGGITNPFSPSKRQFNRDMMHQLDARNLPQWFYDTAKAIGYRIPQDWSGEGNAKDWMHLDLGGKK